MPTPVQNLRTTQRAAMVALKGNSTNLTDTQKTAITTYIAAIDEETAKDPHGLINVLDSCAENPPYGLRTAHIDSDSDSD